MCMLKADLKPISIYHPRIKTDAYKCEVYSPSF